MDMNSLMLDNSTKEEVRHLEIIKITILLNLNKIYIIMNYFYILI